MRKLLLLVLVVAALAWSLQTFTSFKAINYAKDWWRNFDFQALQEKTADFFKSDQVPDASKTLNIFIREKAFTPNSNAIQAGTVVIWHNEDVKPRSVAGENWGSSMLAPGESFSKIFDVAGEYEYKTAEVKNVTGKLIVQ